MFKPFFLPFDALFSNALRLSQHTNLESYRKMFAVSFSFLFQTEAITAGSQAFSTFKITRLKPLTKPARQHLIPLKMWGMVTWQHKTILDDIFTGLEPCLLSCDSTERSIQRKPCLTDNATKRLGWLETTLAYFSILYISEIRDFLLGRFTFLRTGYHIYLVIKGIIGRNRNVRRMKMKI